MKLQDYTEQINKISDVAAKEYSIEQALDKMEEQWAPIEFEVMEYKDTGTYIIKARVALVSLSIFGSNLGHVRGVRQNLTVA